MENRVLVNAPVGGEDTGGPLPAELLERAVLGVLDHEDVTGAEISLTLLDDARIRRLNRRYLNADRPTDVLAFPLHDEGDAVLGDVYVGLAQADRQAAELGLPLPEELVRLAVHGTLHVLGHDHPEGPEREGSDMYRLQEVIVRKIMDGAANGLGRP